MMSIREKRAPSILIVDDEELVLLSLREMFSLESDYFVIAASHPRQALREVERTPLDVVISDYLMPEMNGVEFLKEVMRLQPEAVRILLTGYADKQNAIHAINQAGIYQYLEKPWDNQGLLLVVSNALEKKSLRQQLTEKLTTLDRLVMDHSQLLDRHRLLEQELEMAAQVQRSLLPPRFPQVEGYRFDTVYTPCQALGGDYYDFFARGNDLVILVSDVIGHGAQAALATMLIKGIFQEAASRNGAPLDLLAEMNVKLHRALPEGMYVAASVVCLRPGIPRVELANAGLPFPFVLRAAEKRLDTITMAGTPLGLFPGSSTACHDARDLTLTSDDVLLVATDGIGSIPGTKDELFQDQQLEQCLVELAGNDGGEVIETLVRQAMSFGHHQPLPDDVSLVAITKT